MVNKLSIWNTVLNTNINTNDDVVNYMSMLERKFVGLTALRMNSDQQTKVAILVSSLSEHPEYSSLTVTVNIMQENLATWNHVAMLFPEERKQVQKTQDRSIKFYTREPCTLVYSSPQTSFLVRKGFLQELEYAPCFIACEHMNGIGIESKDFNYLQTAEHTAIHCTFIP